MVEVVDMTESVGLCLIDTVDEQRTGAHRHETGSFDHDLLTSATAQKAWFASGSVSQYMILRDAFEQLGEDAPTPAQGAGGL